MAKDDYFVIAYQVLAYLYACLKQSKPADLQMLTADYFSVGQPYWDYIIQNLYEDGYITGVMVVPLLASPNPAVKIQPHIKITPKGIQHLAENSMFQKIKEVAKDMRGLLPM